MNEIADATRAQVLASDPLRSTWVSANAGSGKTRVLTDRVARLLLAGTGPGKILCLTFTKAAAAEMQRRLFRRLGEWSMLEDAELRAALADIGEDAARFSPDDLQQARTLFARALETPGGLKIQTIHSFCANILRRFPLEAGVSPQFREIDERASAAFLADALERFAAGPEAGCLADFLGSVNDEADLISAVRSVLSARDALDGFDLAQLSQELGIAPDLTEEEIVAETLDRIGTSILQRIFSSLSEFGSERNQTAVEPLADLERQSVSQKFDAMQKVFLTASFGPRSTKGFPVAAVEKADPGIKDCMEDTIALVAEGRDRILGVRQIARMKTIIAFAETFIPFYDDMKAAAGFLDFDDLIRLTRRLLSQSEMEQWVQYRIDGGIDHILVDESQDTSPIQWDIIKTIESEFTDTIADGSQTRTIFVVGDKKQSIFGFQGADAEGFDREQAHFSARQVHSGQALNRVELQHSFRSAGPILELVDRVFDGEFGAGGTHRFLPDRPGRVDLWDFIESAKSEDDQPWYEPVDRMSDSSGPVVLANSVARFIADELTAGRQIPHRNDNGLMEWRVMRPKDIMILLRSRKQIYEPLVDALKTLDVPVAGRDRFQLNEVLAVRDVLSLLAFLDNELDDLSLAEALRSPIFGIAEGQLFALAHARDGTLWESLREHPDHLEVSGRLRGLRNLVDFRRPYDLIEHVLIQMGGRERLNARLGGETDDALDELLAQAIAFEREGTPSLSSFIAWMRASDLSIKREVDDIGDEVRIMTVHGAKGLEAPVVIVPDVWSPPKTPKAEVMTTGEAIFWGGAEDASTPQYIRDQRAALKARETEEYKRLLYVALTRAESWLVFAGGGSMSAGGWYEMVSGQMADRGEVVEAGDLPARWVVQNDNWQERFGAVGGDAPTDMSLPGWLHTRPVVVPKPDEPLSPSQLAEPHALGGEAGLDPELAMHRGEVLHKLLEVLPATDPSMREEMAAHLVRDEPDGDDLTRLALRVIGQPDLEHVFAEDALAEPQVAAYLDEIGARISGRIDRLLITPDVVHAIDFKSNRVVPGSAEEVPLGILAQMSAYDAALRKIWPDREVAVSVLWTETASLMRLPEELLNAALKSAKPLDPLGVDT